MDGNASVEPHKKKIGGPIDPKKIGEFTKTEGGWIRIGAGGREEFTPDSLVFQRSTGKYYRHYGRTCIGWPTFDGEDNVQSLETGERKTMSRSDFLRFRRC